MECSYVPGQGFRREEEQKYHGQSNFMPQQGEGKHVVYQHQDTRFPYQSMILSNNQVEVRVKQQWGWGSRSSQPRKMFPYCCGTSQPQQTKNDV